MMVNSELLQEVETFIHSALIGAPPSVTIFQTCWMENADGERSIIPCPWDNRRERSAVLRALKATMRQRQTVAYCFFSEAKEVVFAVAATKEAHEFKSWDIIRDDKGRVVELRLNEPFKGLGGDLTELLQA
jgi:hypothetical protein